MHEMKKKRKEKEKKKTEEGKQYFINLNLVRKLDLITVAFTRVVLFLFCFLYWKLQLKHFSTQPLNSAFICIYWRVMWFLTSRTTVSTEQLPVHVTDTDWDRCFWEGYSALLRS